MALSKNGIFSTVKQVNNSTNTGRCTSSPGKAELIVYGYVSLLSRKVLGKGYCSGEEGCLLNSLKTEESNQSVTKHN